jgi:hypothetical protein
MDEIYSINQESYVKDATMRPGKAPWGETFDMSIDQDLLTWFLTHSSNVMFWSWSVGSFLRSISPQWTRLMDTKSKMRNLRNIIIAVKMYVDDFLLVIFSMYRQ